MKLIFGISRLQGGGAEKVIIKLINYFYDLGYDTELFVTNQNSNRAVTNDINTNIPIFFIQDSITFHDNFIKRIKIKLVNGLCLLYELLKVNPPQFAVEKSFANQYKYHIEYLKKFILSENNILIVFLQPANQIFIKANVGLKNKLIISERGNPLLYLKSRFGMYFIKYYYDKIDKIIFQTQYALECYPESIQNKGLIIYNPVNIKIKANIPMIRKKKIVNFCRLSPEKNLFLLIDAFCVFYEKHNDYILEIIGNGIMEEKIKNYIKIKKLEKSVFVLPHKNNILEYIFDYSMFVSSSDTEGLSNSMLEAMAIGLPTICTDCPIGGARSVIKDHINGLLVPVRNIMAMSNAMSEIADNKDFSNQISYNAKEEMKKYDEKIIFSKWEKVIKEINNE